MYLRDTAKPGLWTLDWTMDWTMDWTGDDQDVAAYARLFVLNTLS
jgi:hypothetical protein